MVKNNRCSLAELNRLGRNEFVGVIGPVFEHSPWIAETAWDKRPFLDLVTLHRALCQTVINAGEEQQLALIRAHPDLAGRTAQAGMLTAASTAEQASAGLNKLTGEGLAELQTLNRAYRDKFGFPFVICARLNNKAAIFNGLRARLENGRTQEITTALEEIGKIAYLRLKDMVIE